MTNGISNMTTGPGGVPRRLAVALVLLALTGCTASIAYPGPPRHVQIPPGHMPPPGSCRIWFPDRPPGHQPAPGPCELLRYRVPPGAYLVYGG